MGELASRIIDLRERNNMTQVELAKKINLSKSKMSKIESGDRRVTSDELAAFAEVFGVSTDYLLGRPSNNNNNHPQAMTVKEALGTIMSYDGKEVTDHDRKVMEEMMAAYLRNRGMLKEEA